MKIKNILITGGAGFIGSNLLSKLDTANLNIKSTYLNKKPDLSLKNVDFIKTDLTNRESCKNIFENIDCVVMAAAVSSGAKIMKSNPLIHLNDNILMNTIALEESHKNKVKKFIFISSNTVYPSTKKSVTEDDANFNFYKSYHIVAWMKRFTEVMCDIYSNKIDNPMTTIIVRPGNLYGPFDKFDKDKSKVVPALIRKIIENENSIDVWGDGKDIKDFLFIDDFVEVVNKIIFEIEKSDIYNVASGIPVTINEIIKHILKILDKENLKINYDDSMPSMIPIRKINIDKIKKEVNWKPITKIDSGLKKTIDWYLNYFKDKTPEEIEKNDYL